jgi:hypothetical protein
MLVIHERNLPLVLAWSWRWRGVDGLAAPPWPLNLGVLHLDRPISRVGEQFGM